VTSSLARSNTGRTRAPMFTSSGLQPAIAVGKRTPASSSTTA
jgi:hypothetical protein